MTAPHLQQTGNVLAKDGRRWK